MKMLLSKQSLVLFFFFASLFLRAEEPDFSNTSEPQGWKITAGKAETSPFLTPKGAQRLALQTERALNLPMEAIFRFRAARGDTATFLAVEEAAEAKPLLECVFLLRAANHATITARADGESLATDTVSVRSWNAQNKKAGAIEYAWRFPKIRNLWDENDRREIGAAYAQLVPFEEKIFTMRLVLTQTSRQIWVDDRLVAEERVAGPQRARFAIKLSKTAQVLSADFAQPTAGGHFQPLALAYYRLTRNVPEADDQAGLSTLTAADGRSVPMLVPKGRNDGIDLGDSLYRYRLTKGNGPDAGYVNATTSWPGAFHIDPASLTFRAPYRNYQNVWLLAWVDDDSHSVPKGTFRFYREKAGYAASTDFAIGEDALRKNLVTKLPERTSDGKPLYLVKVPVNTDAFYGFRDMADHFLEFELAKPVGLIRSYPDPIYYGFHPGGLPSSIHVAGITLEEAPFGYEVKPGQCSHIFERPGKPNYAITVTNTTDHPIEARVTLQTKSYDQEERNVVKGAAKIAPGGTIEVALNLNLKKLGWHELRIDVEANGVKRENTFSLVLLPPNTRTYGNAPNETRFGLWTLWGHYLPLRIKGPSNESIIAMFRKLGLRRIGIHESFLDAAMVKKYDFLPKGPHTIISVFHQLNENDPEAMKKMVEAELEQVGRLSKDFPEPTYFYGGEWAISKEAQYAPWPRYTGDGDRELTAEEKTRVERQTKIFTAIGKAVREQYPQARLVLQWGAPQGTLAFLKFGFPKELVDGFGMDSPHFEQIPEVSNMTGCINNVLWTLREEAKRFGWPRLPIHWCEGPFFPTNPGALTESEQAEYQIRYFLMGLAYGIDQFESGVVDFDGGNYYGAEHYGAGVFHRTPLENPKPAVAAIATATSMLCGADPIGGVDTGCLTTYCMAFQRAKDGKKIFALWRVNGKVDAKIKVHGNDVVLTDAMGNSTKPPLKDGVIRVSISSSPIWLTGTDQIEGFEFGKPAYESAPPPITRPLADMTADNWGYDGTEDRAYAYNHFAIRRIPDPNLKAEFGTGEEEHADAVSITLPEEPGDRPLATRYGALKPKKPVTIPGKASALGIWIKGNSSWGRIVYQLRDAKGEIWTSNGTKDDWNCDDPHGWSFISFEGWRYVQFPLPGNQPYDSARKLETTWWGARGGLPAKVSAQAGEGIVDLPLTLEKIFVEARNEVPYLSQMKPVSDRSYKLSHLVAVYDAEEDAATDAVAKNHIRKPIPDWSGPSENPIARLAAEGTGQPPGIRELTEPHHFNDGRRMIIHFNQTPGMKYNLYLARYEDGRGAELLKAGVADNQLVTGFRPEIPIYLFLTAIGSDKKETKPSDAYKLVTHDNFAEK